MSGSVASDLVLIFLFTFLFVVGCVIVGHLPRTAIFFFIFILFFKSSVYYMERGGRPW